MKRNDLARLFVGVAYTGAWVWVGAAQPAWSDFASTAFWITSSFVTGLLIGRWWALGLAVVGAIGMFVGNTLNPCVEGDGVECDVNVPALVFGYFMPPAGALLAFGIAVRK